MLVKFMVWIEQKMRMKNEFFSADHMLELLAMVDGLDEEAATKTLEQEQIRLTHMMDDVSSASAVHGVYWTQRLNVEQSLRAGAGELQGWQ